ncbi:MAG: hypothetical protein COV52_07850 [Gammaproteobacteria bacterium CG11_big_fil_rev_8_21_14_0_20_46_22]|nr:MAG: hypothetical protein COW05_03930 [Gammaproteobacteria bacterium CG12_big_fil_rev_8_21_14_0_65_46_12]PIR10670.1 MAG: hypothetical protein COV52_07850 [Gammaproteobacteria bacterium CG11_big_fil_rev_8_21_14_0_20_46_22]
MFLRIIGETHGEGTDFLNRAEQLAEKAAIVLVREGGIYENYPAGKIGLNTYTVENVAAFAYSDVLDFLKYYFTLIKKYHPGYSIITSYLKCRENKQWPAVIKMKKAILHSVELFTELINYSFSEKGEKYYLLQVIFERFCDQVDKKIGCNALKGLVSDDDNERINLFLNHHEVLLLEVKKLVESIVAYIKDKYPGSENDQISLKKSWIDKVFAFDDALVEQEHGRLNTDAVILDLRNYFYKINLTKIFGETDREVWFIVGRAHLPGLKELMKTTPVPCRFVADDRKEALLNLYGSSSVGLRRYTLHTESSWQKVRDKQNSGFPKAP